MELGKPLGFELSLTGAKLVRGFVNLFSDKLDFDEVNMDDIFKGFRIPEASYTRFVEPFLSGENVENVSADELVEHLSSSLSLELSDNEKGFLVGLFAMLPRNLQKIRKDGDLTSAVLDNINLLPIIGKGLEAIQANPDNKNTEKASEIASSVSTKIRDAYIRIEEQRLSANQDTAEQLASMPEEDRRAFLNESVNKSDASPVGRASGNYSDQQAPSWINSTTGEVDSWEEYLRLNPQSTVYDLIQLEIATSEDDLNSEGFDSTMFAGWLTSKNNDVNATKADGTPVKWSASQAIKFIYDLADEGNTKKINELQNMLREAGYFTLLGEGGALPIPGVVDTTMEQAWGLFLTDAARMNKTPAEMFQQKKTQFRQMVSTGDGMVGQDLAAISQNIDSLAYDILGRRLSAIEKQSLYTAVREWERKQLATQLYDDRPTTIDINARLAQLIESENKNEISFNVAEEMDSRYRKWFGD